MKVALAHHWLLRARGGERVLARLAAMFPDAPILTTVVDRAAAWPAAMSEVLRRARVSPLQWTRPRGGRRLRYLVPFMPLAMRVFTGTLRGFDTLLVSDAGLAKCIPVPPGTRKLVYAHTPMRHLWQQDERLGEEFPRILAGLARATARRLRSVDREAARGVDGWAANSETTRRRLVSLYGIPSERIRIVYPPVWILERDDSRSTIRTFPARRDVRVPRAGLLVVSPMVPYKRDDLAILAASRLGVPLTVVGDGPERRRLTGMAGPRVRFLGHVDDESLVELYRTSEALVFPAHEDFGLVPVEAMAMGCPVLAFRAGGATETVSEGVGGVFFDEQTPESVMDGIGRVLAHRWDPLVVRASVERFSSTAFEQGIREWIGLEGGATQE
jgi:glycosyltransferase involved in cell wall biosynthesis